jgi:hypothetical protein
MSVERMAVLKVGEMAEMSAERSAGRKAVMLVER